VSKAQKTILGPPLPGSKSIQIYLNGALVPKEQAVLSVFDHGLLYGDGVFEGIRAYNGRVFRLKEHLDRLYRSAQAIVLNIGMTFDQVQEAVLQTLRANGLKDAYIRLVVTRGAGDLGLDPRKCPKATVFIITDKISLYPQELYENGLSVITSSIRRNIPEALNPCIKSLNYLNNVLAKVEAARQNAPEAIMLNREGYVAECTGDNIFFIKNGKIFTPPTSAGILVGVTRQVVMELCEQKLGNKVIERNFPRYDLYGADEVFLTGTGAEVIAGVKIDGRVIGKGVSGPLTKQLIKHFREYANSTGTPVYETTQAKPS
jgi:branched-chain amino acid aminotransferase